jgi:heme/copper-type cytochrome/quinol oxidase subunit 4
VDFFRAMWSPYICSSMTLSTRLSCELVAIWVQICWVPLHVSSIRARRWFLLFLTFLLVLVVLVVSVDFRAIWDEHKSGP